LIDQMDLKIINELQADCQQSNGKIGKSVGISEAAVRRRVLRLIEEGYLKILAIPNMQKLGKPFAASLGLRVDPKCINQVANILAKMDVFHRVNVVTGHYDIVLAGRFKDVDDLYILTTEVLSKVKGVLSVESSIIISCKKDIYSNGW